MEEKKKRVKDRIVSAAWELFYEKGYDATTVDDIIRLSDTSKGSFYYYFDGKDALLNTLSTVLDDLYLSLKEEMDPYMDSFEKLMFLNYRSHLFMERSIKVDLLASLYSTQLISKGERSLLDQNREYYKLISSVMEEGQKRGEINRRKSVNQGLPRDTRYNRHEYSHENYMDMNYIFKEKKESSWRGVCLWNKMCALINATNRFQNTQKRLLQPFYKKILRLFLLSK